MDTTAEAHRLQGEVYARMSAAQRVTIAFELSEMVARLARAGIRRRHPEYSDGEVFRAWARLKLGDELTRAVWPTQELIEP